MATSRLVAKPRVRGMPRRIERADVIGGGPAGLSAAILLASLGVDVTVFEARRLQPGLRRRAHLAFRNHLLASVEGLGTLPSMLERISPIDSIRVADPKPRQISNPTFLDFDQLPGSPAGAMAAAPSALVVMSDIEEVHLDEAVRQGATLNFGATAQLSPNAHGGYRERMVRLDSDFLPVGDPLDIGSPDLVVVADGCNSPTRESLKIPFNWVGPSSRLVGAAFKMNLGSILHGFVTPDGNGGAVKSLVTGHGLYPATWVAVELPRGMKNLVGSEPATYVAARVAALLGQRVGEGDITWAARNTSPTGNRIAGSFTAGDNVVLFGDAAREGDPFEGGGLHTALVWDLEALRSLVEGQNQGTQGREEGLAEYERRGQEASEAWFAPMGIWSKPEA